MNDTSGATPHDDHDENGGRRMAPLFRVVTTLTCPRCGEGKLFSGFLTLADSCDNCGLGYAGHDSGDGPAYLVSFVMSIAVTVAALLVEIAYEPPLWVHALLWPVMIFGGTLGTLRPVKALMVAMQYRHRDVETYTNANQS